MGKQRCYSAKEALSARALDATRRETFLAFLSKCESAGGEPEKISHWREDTKDEQTHVVRH